MITCVSRHRFCVDGATWLELMWILTSPVVLVLEPQGWWPAPGEPAARATWEGSSGGSGDSGDSGGSGSLGGGPGPCRRVHADVVAPLFRMLRAVVSGGDALRETEGHAEPVSPLPHYLL